METASAAPRSLTGEPLHRLQQTLLEMLQVVDDTCCRLDVPYWLDSGTCLGAVRHGGFIPWDDDIDVGMMLPDWQRFLREAPTVLPAGYSLHTWEDTPGLPGFWAWLWKDGTRFVDPDHQATGCDQAVFIDLFAFVRLDENPGIADRQRRRMQWWQGLSYLRSIKHPTGAKGAVRTLAPAAHEVLSRCVSQRFLAHEFWRATKTEHPGDYIINPSYAGFQPLPYQVMMPPSRIDFAGLEVSAPHDPVRYLELKFGDWQQLPPEGQRHTHAPLVLDLGDGVNLAAGR